jgi:ribosomal protein S8
MGFGDLSQPLQDAIDKTKNARLQQKLNNDELASTQSQIDDIIKKEGFILK